MELENIMLSEVSQVMKDKYHYDLTYKWEPNQQNKQASKTEPETLK